MFIPECVALAVSDRESGWGCKNLLFMAVGLSVVCILGGLIRSRTNVTCLVGSSGEFGELTNGCAQVILLGGPCEVCVCYAQRGRQSPLGALHSSMAYVSAGARAIRPAWVARWPSLQWESCGMARGQDWTGELR